jgi:hypothetical protein
MPVAPDLCGIALEDRYELLELIGEGAFGRVYRGRDRRLHRAVAVKVIKPWWAEDPEWVATFERETRILARLSDPGIVQIHDVGHAREGLYYVSELVAGENLAERLRRAGGAGLPASEVRRITFGLCRALAAAHSQRIVHRDVKPANVLLGDGDGAHPPRVKVGDFGVARLAEGSSGAPSVVVGTPKYMAPEQGRGGPTTPATDVYSVGAVVFEMLTGRPPFAGISAVALALSHLSDPPPTLPAAVPGDLRELVTRALAKDPAARYPDAGAMAGALEHGEITGPGRSGRSGRSARSGGAGRGPTPRAPEDATRPQPPRGPRRNLNPAARRRSAALLSIAGALLGALIAAAVLVGDHGDGARAAAGPPVEVPLLVGENGADARVRLRSLGLRTSLQAVPAPGIRPGTVTSQRPLAGRTAARHGTVRLSVSEVPRWRTVSSFSGRNSVAVRIRGEHWRILTSVQNASHCAVLGLFCHGTSATVLRRASGDSPVTSVGLGDGAGEAHTFTTGPGVYRVSVDPASGSTRWTIQIQDDY